MNSLVSLEALGGEEEVLSGESGREGGSDVLSFSDGSESRRVGVALGDEEKKQGQTSARGRRAGSRRDGL